MSSLKERFEDAQRLKNELSMARNCKAENIYETLKIMKDITFSLGDILIRKDRVWNDSEEDYTAWYTERFSDANDSHRKYEVVHVDEVGLCYVQKIGMKGGNVGDVKCIAGFDNAWVKFEHDPDFIDHHILCDEDDEFDPLEIYKEKRSEYFKTARQT